MLSLNPGAGWKRFFHKKEKELLETAARRLIETASEK